MNRTGERIKKRREIHHMHLNELAEKVGISSSALSQIENGKSFPSLHTLKNIAQNLHTTVGQLIGEDEIMTNNPVVRHNEVKHYASNQSGTTVYDLSRHDTNKHIDTLFVRFSKTSGIEGLFTDTQGKVFCYVLTGEIRFKIEETFYTLKQGDSISFNAKSSIDAVNSSEGISEMLWIKSPASY